MLSFFQTLRSSARVVSQKGTLMALLAPRDAGSNDAYRSGCFTKKAERTVLPRSIATRLSLRLGVCTRKVTKRTLACNVQAAEYSPITSDLMKSER